MKQLILSGIATTTDFFPWGAGMFFPDGRAACAWLYSLTVNGTLGEVPEPYANDRDRGQYFALRDRDGQK